MSVELKPLGIKCNIQCQYCYQNPMRDAGNKTQPYDLEKVKAAIVREGGPFSLFGGEALLMPESDLRSLWSWGLEVFGRNSLQTNGTLIDESHIRLFKSFKVGVGISVDGPEELNDARWAGTLARTREATLRTHAAIELLCREGIPPGLIVTLHRGNASRDKLPRMLVWFKHLEEIGIRSVRLHLLEVDASTVADTYALSLDECAEALLGLLSFEQRELKILHFDLFRDMRDLLVGEDEKTACIWNACDPYTTAAVHGVEGDGQSTNCSRTNKEGIDFLKSNTQGFERYLVLYRTPQELGGCQGCRFFLMCKGQCPGTALDGDWRLRSSYCEVWKRVFEHLEIRLLSEGIIPISVRADRSDLEALFLRSWNSGQNTKLSRSLRILAQERRLGATVSASGSDRGINSQDLSSTAPDNFKKERPTKLDATIPQFSRLVWVSAHARELWEPRMRRIQLAWSDIEWLSVAQGVRQCGITNMSADSFVSRAQQWAGRALGSFAVFADTLCVADSTQAYQVVVGSAAALLSFKAAFDNNRVAEITSLLGYPSCCSEYFSRLWAERPINDGTWEIALRSAGRLKSDYSVEIACPWQTNVLWQSTGIRAIPHLPCRYDCERAVDFADRLTGVGRQNGYGQEIDWLREMLSWPVEWTAMHGVAEIRTPILKISTRTDTTVRKCVVRNVSDFYPEEGAFGLRFPYRRLPALRLSDSKAFTHGLVAARQSVKEKNYE